MGRASCILQLERERRHGRKFSTVTALMSAAGSGLLAERISLKLALPLVVWEHRTHFARGFASVNSAYVVRRILSRASVVAPISEGLRRNIDTFMTGHTMNQIVVPNPTDQDRVPVGTLGISQDFPVGDLSLALGQIGVTSSALTSCSMPWRRSSRATPGPV